jgi:hypothetical protein
MEHQLMLTLIRFFISADISVLIFKCFGMGFRKIVQDLNMQRGQLCEMKVSERILLWSQ